MKKTLIFLFVSFLMAACVSENETIQSPAESQYARDVAIINSMGYDTTDVYQIKEGYVVEGDILLTREHLDSFDTPQTRQTFNMNEYRLIQTNSRLDFNLVEESMNQLRMPQKTIGMKSRDVISFFQTRRFIASL